jgi:hypothetical protein
MLVDLFEVEHEQDLVLEVVGHEQLGLEEDEPLAPLSFHVHDQIHWPVLLNNFVHVKAVFPQLHHSAVFLVERKAATAKLAEAEGDEAVHAYLLDRYPLHLPDALDLDIDHERLFLDEILRREVRLQLLLFLFLVELLFEFFTIDEGRLNELLLIVCFSWNGYDLPGWLLKLLHP